MARLLSHATFVMQPSKHGRKLLNEIVVHYEEITFNPDIPISKAFGRKVSLRSGVQVIEREIVNKVVSHITRPWQTVPDRVTGVSLQTRATHSMMTSTIVIIHQCQGIGTRKMIFFPVLFGSSVLMPNLSVNCMSHKRCIKLVYLFANQALFVNSMFSLLF